MLSSFLAFFSLSNAFTMSSLIETIIFCIMLDTLVIGIYNNLNIGIGFFHYGSDNYQWQPQPSLDRQEVKKSA